MSATAPPVDVTGTGPDADARRRAAEERRSEEQRLLDEGKWKGTEETGFVRSLGGDAGFGGSECTQQVGRWTKHEPWLLKHFTNGNPGKLHQDEHASLIDALQEAEKRRDGLPFHSTN